jgi:hypothetical protein
MQSSSSLTRGAPRAEQSFHHYPTRVVQWRSSSACSPCFMSDGLDMRLYQNPKRGIEYKVDYTGNNFDILQVASRLEP